jgi:hypothetical protein
MIDMARVEAAVASVLALSDEEQEAVLTQVERARKLVAAGFSRELDPRFAHLRPTPAEIMASIERGRREGAYRIVRDAEGNKTMVRVDANL